MLAFQASGTGSIPVRCKFYFSRARSVVRVVLRLNVHLLYRTVPRPRLTLYQLP